MKTSIFVQTFSVQIAECAIEQKTMPNKKSVGGLATADGDSFAF